MDFNLTQEQLQIRDEIRKVCKEFPDAYWREIDGKKKYPEAFVRKLSELGWLAALIPEEYGGTGLGITEASIILEEINHSGGVATACHAQMYTMGTLLRHGNDEQKKRYLPKIATGELRLQAFGVTEPDAGSESTRIQTSATREGDKYIVNGQKIFISRVLQSDLMLLLARTTPYDQLKDKTRGLSVFIVDLKANKSKIDVKPLDLMINHHTNALFLDNVEVPVENLIGEEGMGFRYIIDGWNAERILVAAEAVGDGRWFVERAAKYASERVVFGRAIGSNQGIQFPIAQAYAQIEAADLVRYQAATKFDRKEKCGAEANMAKFLASEAAWAAANACLTTHGGYGFAVEYDVERKFRETRLLTVAPVSNNLVLAYLGQHVLGMPKSY
ncbi:MAG TPA: acyl-CoA dehydrogenase family protein [Candidatus Binatia bacterium]|nr:acyl-CoA dehydrogenase family protein [Candidatus Binatia bacterium]